MTDDKKTGHCDTWVERQSPVGPSFSWEVHGSLILGLFVFGILEPVEKFCNEGSEGRVCVCVRVRACVCVCDAHQHTQPSGLL